MLCIYTLVSTQCIGMYLNQIMQVSGHNILMILYCKHVQSVLIHLNSLQTQKLKQFVCIVTAGVPNCGPRGWVGGGRGGRGRLRRLSYHDNHGHTGCEVCHQISALVIMKDNDQGIVVRYELIIVTNKHGQWIVLLRCNNCSSAQLGSSWSQCSDRNVVRCLQSTHSLLGLGSSLLTTIRWKIYKKSRYSLFVD